MTGTTVSHYEILERLGGGGMGVVYKARDLGLDRLVALKFLENPKSGGEPDRRRFTLEARSASALDHPNICTVYEIDEAEDGRLFIAMAFCEGETLARKIARGPLAPEAAADIAAQIADGLAAAHERGIVHRDVKPANVIVGRGGRVKIVDFGIARLIDHSRLTRAGIALGTVSYMAPEQLRGEPVDHRADVWSLGVVLYEMLTGELPFPARSEDERVGAILHRSPRPMFAVRPEVAPALEPIAARAMAKRPEDRYPEIARMAEELRAAGKAGYAGPAEEQTLMEIPQPPGRDPSGRPGTRRTADRLAPNLDRYRLLGQLGGGGMGVVYEAEDTLLGRTVALKFLPPELTRDPEAKERFLREARTASALDHPNLCTVYEIGETAEGRLFLAMARYDGETLKKRLERGPLPIEEAADVARQVAQGLAKAHRQGIVHRDVKPANLMLTTDGVVKILDFGLAKLAGAAAITRTGSSLGTPAYMAPEQARGEEVDARADVWSLGAVLYEMLAGCRPFPGEHEQAALYAVLHEEPKSLSSLRPEVPAELERIVGRMLAKDAGRRYAAAEEVLADLRSLFGSSTTWLPSQPAPSRRRASPGLWAGAVLLVVFAALAANRLLSRGDEGGTGPVPLNFQRLTGQEGSETFPSLSPAGDFFVYVKADGGDLDVFLQRVGGGNPINLTADSPADDTQPAYSPDGQQIAFRSDREGGGIFLMGATGESVRRLTNFGYNPAWSPDGKEVLVATAGVTDPRVRTSLLSEIWRVEVATGSRKLVAGRDAVQPSWSPSGRRIAYWGAVSGRRVLWTVAAEGGEPVPVIDDPYLNWSPVWSPEGNHLYFASDRGGSMNLWRVPVDESSGEVQGEPEPILTPSKWSALPSLSRDGRKILYATQEGKANLERFAFDPAAGHVSGPAAPVTSGSRAVRFGEASPDGRWVVFTDAVPQEDLYLVRPDGSGLRRLTQDVHKDRNPRWLPEGDRILFYSNRGGTYQAWTIRPDGSGLEQVTAAAEDLSTPLISPDGRRLVCAYGNRGAAVVDLGQPIARRTPRLLPAPGNKGEIYAATSWSADGRRLAGVIMARDESRQPGVVLYSFDSHRYERLTDHGGVPIWLPDGRQLLYEEGGRIRRLDIRTKKSAELLTPSPNSAFNVVSVAPDGKSLYAVRTLDEGDLWMLTLQ